MEIMKKRGILLLLMIFVFALPNISYSEQAQLLWSTRFSLSQEYNDNIYLDNNDAVDDWITTISQGLTLNIKTEETDARVDFQLGYAFYKDRSDNNSFRGNINLSGFKDIPITENLMLDLDSSLNISEDPVEADEEVVSTRRSRNRYMRGRSTTRLTYRFGEEDQLYGGYGYTLLENSDPDIEDSKEHRPFIGLNYWFDLHHGINLNLSHARGEFETSSDFDDTRAGAIYTLRLSPTTSWNISYSRTSKDYSDEEENDYEIQNISLGLSHQFSEGLSGSASAGYYRDDVDDESSEKGVSWSASVSKQHEDLSASVSAGYYNNNPEEGGTDREFSGRLSVGKQFEYGSLLITGNTSIKEQIHEAENLGFSRQKGISASYSLQAAEDFNINLTGLYRENKYLDLDNPRKDKTWQGRVSFSYQLLEWLTASLNLSHRKQDSTDDINDYKVNQAFFTLSLPYEGKPIDF